ncbi:MAG: hypothetical protein KUG76_00930, partial [Gammaproteobacteria bacterium]|nr:hypothetical protein [Gammaproteobacteria bacterium]
TSLEIGAAKDMLEVSSNAPPSIEVILFIISFLNIWLMIVGCIVVHLINSTYCAMFILLFIFRRLAVLKGGGLRKNCKIHGHFATNLKVVFYTIKR